MYLNMKLIVIGVHVALCVLVFSVDYVASVTGDGAGPSGSKARPSQSNLELTEQEKGVYEDIFILFDSDKDGKLTMEDMGKLMNSIGQQLEEAQLKALMENLDKNNNKTIELEEFLQMMAEYKKRGLGENALKDMFSICDKDKNNLISTKEILDFMIGLKIPVSNDDISNVIKEVDRDGDGQINFAEFAAMVNKIMNIK